MLLEQHAPPNGPDQVHAPGPPYRLRTLLSTAGVIVLAFYLLSGLYTVRWGDKAVVRRFGRVVAELGPGLHYRLPWPVDQVDHVSVSQLRRIETPGTLVLTGDENLVIVRLGVHYTIEDVTAYLFNQRDPETMILSAAEAAIRRVVAEESVDAILTAEKDLIEDKVARLIQATLSSYNSGFHVMDVQMLESNPPPAVADAFRDVASAREDKNTYINEARAYENQEVALARGDGFKTIESAKAYQIKKVNNTIGEAVRFLFRRYAYLESPGITQQRLYLEAVEKVLTNVQKYLVDPSIELIETDLWFTEQGFLPPPSETP
jgi:membrane protease subunit HflK